MKRFYDEKCNGLTKQIHCDTAYQNRYPFVGNPGLKMSTTSCAGYDPSKKGI